MTPEWQIFCLALATTWLCTPLVLIAARRYGLVDKPDGHRKLHRKAIPLGGGVAVLIGLLVVVGVLSFASPFKELTGNSEARRWLFALSASAIGICLLGLVDDRIGLRGRHKLAGQAVVAAFLISSGLSISKIDLFGWEWELGVIWFPVTLLWLLGAINSLNLIDGMDGLATTVGVILSVSLSLLASIGGHYLDAILALAIAGSLVGFFMYNKPPARIFLGDGGSMLIGFLLGALAIRCSLKGPATVALAAPTAIWAIPAFDTMMAILRRKLTGRSIYSTDRAHLHHRLRQRGMSDFKAVLTIGFLCMGTCVGALASILLKNEFYAVASVLIVLGLLIVFRVFGHTESKLFATTVMHTLVSFVPSRIRRRVHPRQHRTRLQGRREWESIWNSLVAFAERFDLTRIKLNLTLPSHHEEYYASWQNPREYEHTQLWSTEIPLIVNQKNVGRLAISGFCENGAASVWLGELIAGLKPFETEMLILIQELEQELQPTAAKIEPPHFHSTPTQEVASGAMREPQQSVT